MRDLRFDNRFVRELPGDPEQGRHVRQVHGACYSRVEPTPVRAPALLAWSPEVASLLGLDEADVCSQEFAEVFGGNALVQGMEPYAACYGGHQFGLTKEEVTQKMNQYPACTVDIDRNGLEQLKKLLGDRLESIFILVDKETIFSRFMMQGDKLEDVKARIDLAEANGEYDNWRIADYVVKNTGTVECAVWQILAIMGRVKPVD